MAGGDIYVQVTATVLSGRSKSVVVLVPRNAIDEYRFSSRKGDDEFAARALADPLASYVFTHRPTFNGGFKVAHSFSAVPPSGLDLDAPELTRGDLKAWLL